MKRTRAAVGLVIAGWAPLLMQFVVARVDDPTLKSVVAVLLLALTGTGWMLVWRNAEHPGLHANDVVTLGLSKSSQERPQCD
jgi:hypothetical protein